MAISYLHNRCMSSTLKVLGGINPVLGNWKNIVLTGCVWSSFYIVCIIIWVMRLEITNYGIAYIRL